MSPIADELRKPRTYSETKEVKAAKRETKRLNKIDYGKRKAILEAVKGGARESQGQEN